jgi:hypothetical protein
MSRRFGIIVEDQTDGEVIRVVIRRRVGSEVSVKIRSQKGCSKIKTKAARVISDLVRQENISDIIIVHDLDRNPVTNQLNDEGKLRKQLSDCCETGNAAIRRLICIPIEELEAWLWADPAVVKKVGRGRGEGHPKPHLIARPKESLQRLSRGANAKPRYSTQDNGELAESLDLDLCAKRCPSFRALIAFLEATAEANRT